MTHTTLVLTISVLFVVGMMPLHAFAAQPDTPNGQPFNDIDEKIAQLEAQIAQMKLELDAKDAELEAKDMSLMQKDMELMDDLSDLDAETAANFGAVKNALAGDESVCDESFEGDNTLCQASEEFAGNYELLCENVPIVMDATKGVGIGVLATFDGLNTAIDGINVPLNAMDNWELKFTIPIKDPSFSIPDPELHTKTITVATIDFKIPTSFHVHASTKTFNIPDPTIDLGKPLSFIAPIPSIPDTVSDSTALAFEDLEDCSIVD